MQLGDGRFLRLVAWWVWPILLFAFFPGGAQTLRPVPAKPADKAAAADFTPDWSPPLDEDRGERRGYSWRGLIWQTIEFDAAEHSFRANQDYLLRDLIAHKPFWHDYIASVHQWNMGRFSDGDDFLVDDVGHPMQGAVSAFLEIQNSPTDSRIQWGEPGYARSRFKGFLWATVFSTQQKVSPAGEAGVGNDGGYTYGNQCHYQCTSANFGPGTGDTKYTNNTGWTDLVITPTVGMLWVVAEDVLDKEVSDRLRERYPGKLWPKIVRGGLSPARSFANLLRWRNPWYRDFEHAEPVPDRVYFFSADDWDASHRVPSLEVAPYLSRFAIATNTASCFNCRQTVTGSGVQATAHIRGWLSFDSVVSYHAGASPLPSDRAGGDMLFAAFGLSATREWRYYAAHIAVRPGLLRFNRAYLTSPRPVVITTVPPGIGTEGADPASREGPGVVDANGTAEQPKLGDITHFVWNVGVSGDYKITSHLGIRAGLDENVVRYRTDKVNTPGIGVPPYLSWLSKQNFINRSSYSIKIGPVFSF